MKNRCGISIIVPFCGPEEYSDSGLVSLVQQTYRNLEIIGIENNVSPDTSALLKQCAKNDSRVKIISGHEGSFFSAYNAGLSSAAGEYICFSDPQTVFSPEAMQICIFTLKKTKADVLVFQHYDMDTVSGEKKAHHFPQKILRRLTNGQATLSPQDLSADLFCMVPGLQNLIFRRSMLEEKKLAFQNLRRSSTLNFICMALLQASEITLSDFCFYPKARDLIEKWDRDSFCLNIVEFSAVKDFLCSQKSYPDYMTGVIRKFIELLQNELRSVPDYGT